MWGSRCHVCPRPPGLYPKKVGNDIVKAAGAWKGLKIIVELTIQNTQTQMEVVSSASALIIKVFKEPPRDRKKQKILNSVEVLPLMTLSTLPNVVLKTQHRSLARELSGTIKEFLGIA